MLELKLTHDSKIDRWGYRDISQYNHSGLYLQQESYKHGQK